jgi:deoxycytidylate deaminase
MRQRPSFVIALVGAVGSLLREASAELKSEVEGYGYSAHVLRLSAAFSHVRSDVQAAAQRVLNEDPLYASGGRYAEIRSAMATGNAARAAHPGDTGVLKNGCLAELAIEAVATFRQRAPKPLCVIIDSLKTVGELNQLRQLYRERLVLVAVHTPKADRSSRLVHQLQQTTGRSPVADEGAVRLMGIDERERGTSHGQDVERVFAHADAYVVGSVRDPQFKRQVQRIVSLLFASPFETANADESAMMHAHCASLRTACMGRAVGAAITTVDGDLVATGFNEVPRFGGGPYGSEQFSDGRDYVRSQDENFAQRRALVQQLLRIAQEEGLLKPDLSVEQAAVTVATSPAGKDMLANNLTEFGRDVHAEMAALASAAKRGAAVNGCKLFTTTFPCHNCAKHILAAGISEVVFVEAYPKSFAEAFHSDSLTVDRAAPNKLLVRAFAGIAPRLYGSIFAWRTRRSELDGKAVFGDRETSEPWFTLTVMTPEEQVLLNESDRDEVRNARRERLGVVFDLQSAMTALLGEVPRPLRKTGRPPTTPEAPPSSREREAS